MNKLRMAAATSSLFGPPLPSSVEAAELLFWSLWFVLGMLP
jgi:hypothetical protein